MQFGHTAEECKQACCRNCGEEGHVAVACPRPKKCHGCGSLAHLFRDCTDLRKSYAAAVSEDGPSTSRPAAGQDAGGEAQKDVPVPEVSMAAQAEA